MGGQLVAKAPGVKRRGQKNRGWAAAVVKLGEGALLLGRLGGFFDSGLLAFQVGDVALLLNDFVVLFAHGFKRFECVGL
jgi:hypothetical protein